jgi:hypothetical protein
MRIRESSIKLLGALLANIVALAAALTPALPCRRIRESSVKLLGELLFKIAGTSGKVQLDGGDDAEGAATEHYAAALVETLGEETLNDVLARLYLVRCAVGSTRS